MEVQVLVDNATDSLSTVPKNVTLEWRALMKAGMRELAGSCQCCANHGLSLVITARRDGIERKMLFDAGPLEFAVEYNGTRLGIDFGAIEAVALSHGHWDHAGGLPMAFDLIRKSNGGRPVACYLHPGMFRKRALPLPGGESNFVSQVTNTANGLAGEFSNRRQSIRWLTKNKSTLRNARMGNMPFAAAIQKERAPVEDSQEKAIEVARQMFPGVNPHIERVRNVKTGGRDQWRDKR